MALFASNLAPASTDRALGAAKIQRSLRFNSEDTTYLNRTPSSASNRKTWTWSSWVKRDQASAGTNRYMFMAGQTDGNDNVAHISFDSNDRFRLYGISGSFDFKIRTNNVYRDTTAWYHVMVAFDTTQATASNRVKLYVNGVQITDSLGQSDYPSQNHDSYFNNNVLHNIGRYNSGTTQWFEGYMAETNFIDGYAYDSSYFGFTDPQTGIWMPKRYEGTYGTNGFYLDYSDNSSTASLGIDKSPNGNDWTTNNLSVTAGEGNDSVLDTPTKNWATLNPLEPTSNVTFSEGNLKAVKSNAGFIASSNFVVTSGKWYMEMKYVSGTSNHMISVGFGNPDRSYQRLVRGGDGELTPNTGNVAVTFADPDVLMLALDVDNGKWYIGKNGSYMLSGDPVNGTGFVHSGLSSSEGFKFIVINNTSTGGQTISANFGQQGFTYTPPTGFKAFNSSNIQPDPTINTILRPQRHFDTILYTGNDGSQTITGLEFDPDFVWAKNRQDNGYHHDLYDTVRGNNLRLFSSQTQAEATGYLQFGVTGGFSLTSGGGINSNNKNHVAWCWKAGGAAVSNTNGNITSSVSVNEEAGFSIVSYTGNGSNGQTIGHGLGKKPAWIILKNRDASQNWRVWHKELASDGSKRLLLDAMNASEDAGFLNDTAPTSTIFTLGNADDAWNSNGDKFIAYCWAEIPGYSKFGSYTGNGSTNGTYVHLGFKPAFIITKQTNSTGSWFIFDNKRNGYNEIEPYVMANVANGEATDLGWDILSNGFKNRNSYSATNGSGNTFVYMAFAEQPGATPFDTFANSR